MNATATAAKIENITWIEAGQRAHFQSARGWGVRRGSAFLSFSGVRPSVWDTKAVATEIAATVDADAATWIAVTG